MALKLPPVGSELREMFELADLARPLALPSFRQCVHSARSMFERAAAGSIAAVQFICMRADGSLELVQFGPKGGHRTLWKFGNPGGV